MRIKTPQLFTGYQRACELAFTGRNVSAKECKEFGLVNKIVPTYGVTKIIH
jgi:enoyl-CoA hydratase/carnithine racemase